MDSNISNNTEEYLPIISPETGEILDIAAKNEVRTYGLPYGQFDLWVPSHSDDQLIVQIKTGSHGKRVATAGGGINANKDAVTKIIGKNISELAPDVVIEKGRRETGLDFTSDDITHIGTLTQIFHQPNPANKLWQNGSRLVYLLQERIDLEQILRNKDREPGVDFIEVHMDELLALSKGQDLYKTRFEHPTYKQILRGIQSKMKQF